MSPRARDGVGSKNDGGKRGASKIGAVWAGAEKDNYAIVKEESTCFDSAELVDAHITDSDVSSMLLPYRSMDDDGRFSSISTSSHGIGSA